MIYLLLWKGLFTQSSSTSLDSDVISYKQPLHAMVARGVAGAMVNNALSCNIEEFFKMSLLAENILHSHTFFNQNLSSKLSTLNC